MKHSILSLFLVFCTSILLSQPHSLHSGEMQQALKKLDVTGSALYIAAHPDDENTRLLAWLANEKKVRTGYLSLTRGDGGQNLIGKEQGESLGLIRTQELLAARRTDGAEQFFTRSNDFGFSKNPAETFTFWNHDSVLADVVYTIRRFRPDVIICRFPTTGEGGHGHHTASAILALEAFTAAADPTMFPWQLATAPVWQCRRIFWNTFNFGGTNTTAPNQLKVETGNYNVLLGKSYGEIAAESRSMHKSQGFGTGRQRGSAIEYFKLLKGDSAHSDLLEGIDLSWTRVKNSEAVRKQIALILGSFEPAKPSTSVPALFELRKLIQLLDSTDAEARYWQKVKLKEVDQLILNAAGIWAEASAGVSQVVPGELLSYSVQIVSRSDASATLKRLVTCTGKDTSLNYKLRLNENFILKKRDLIPSTQAYSEPYWLTAPKSAGAYVFPGLKLSGQAENDPAFMIRLDMEIAGQSFQISTPIIYKSTDPVKGEVYRPIEVLPPITINPESKTYVFSKSQIKNIAVLLKANKDNVSGTLNTDIGEGFRITSSPQSFSLSNKGDEVLLLVGVQALEENRSAELKYTAMINNNEYNDAIRRINYDHIPAQFYLEPSLVKLKSFTVKKSNPKIAYIPGAGDDVAESLRQVGFEVTILTDEALKTADLSNYKAVITGVRAYNVSEKLFLQKAKLENYVREGGNLIIQYNTNSRVGPLQSGIGPFPFTISRERVTDEKAEVTFIQPSHPVLNTPNKLSKTDFDNWVQERGIYFATECDPHYQKILSMHDAGEADQAGSLIIAPLGKGNFIYTGLAFFRQLPAGVSGAYRLFANLIELKSTK